LRKGSIDQKRADILQIALSTTSNNKINKYMPIIRWVGNGLIKALIKSKIGTDYTYIDISKLYTI
jgi:hypothetical protein